MLVGCASSGVSANGVQSDEGVFQSEPREGGAYVDPERVLSERQKWQMELGDTGILRSHSGEELLRFSIEDMQVLDVADCPNSDANPPENGYFVALEAKVEASSSYSSVENDLQIDNPLRWRMIDSGGETVALDLGTASALFCLDGKGWLANAAPGERSSGLVVLDLPELNGTLVHEEHYSGTGWEWQLELGS